MKNRKKLIKRIGAWFCAFVVGVSVLGALDNVYGAITSDDALLKSRNDLIYYSDYVPSLPSDYGVKYSEYALLFNPHSLKWVCYLFNADEYALRVSSSPYNGVNCFLYHFKSASSGGVAYRSSDGVNWTKIGNTDLMLGYLNYDNGEVVILEHLYHSSSVPVVFSDITVFEGNEGLNEPSGQYNSSLGYLQNVSRKSTYIRDAIYNYDDDSLTYHWYHDLQSSSGVDLTNGDYKIRHYISNATVKGYEKEDIIEMSDRYLMAEYDASQGYFSYLQKDYLEKIEELGYVEPSWIDIYLKGYFTLQHHYFQIVNTATNEVGGYLHIYPRDANEDNFGVEMEYEGLDDNLDVDPNGPSGNFDSTTGSGETVEDALENADEPKLDDLSGVEEFIGNVQAYGDEVENVSKAFGAMLGQFPPWVLGAIGIGFGLLVVGGVIKALGG